MDKTRQTRVGSGGWLTRCLPYDEAAPLVMSMLCLVVTVSFWSTFFNYGHWSDWHFLLWLVPALIVTVRSFEVGVDPWLTLVPGLAIAYMFIGWPLSANHHWFFIWGALPVLMRPDLLTGETFSRYVSVSMGVMMIAAGIQKLIGGNYLDGSFFSYLAVHGSPSERTIAFICDFKLTSEDMTPCDAMVWVSWLSIFWQFVIGAFLLLHLQNRLVYTLEIAFLLGVGTIANEWIFQAINLCFIIFVMRCRVPVWFFAFLSCFVILGIYGIDSLLWYFGRVFA